MSRRIDLDSLQTHAPTLTQAVADYFAEAAAVSLDRQNHLTGTQLAVECDTKSETVQVSWASPVTNHTRNAHGDDQVRVGNGACAISLLVISELEGLRAVRQSLKWNGVDYFLSPADQITTADINNPLLFNYSAVVEISGIQEPRGTNTVDYRINKKVRRVEVYKQSSKHQTVDITSYYSVVDFDQPRSKTVRK